MTNSFRYRLWLNIPTCLKEVVTRKAKFLIMIPYLPLAHAVSRSTRIFLLFFIKPRL